MWPRCAAGFTTAFGAHGVAASLGGHSDDAVTSLPVLGGLLALYDGAEVLLNPVFGAIADRVGAGTGLITPLGFAALAASTRPERLGHTDGIRRAGPRAWRRWRPSPPGQASATAVPRSPSSSPSRRSSCSPAVAAAPHPSAAPDPASPRSPADSRGRHP
ncbi:hypothetical protein [Actinophytocola sp.]|uniref:hypothetical protein n=1 Tax=Actinophytocola sp. TaxID=1872138 RepID=UPI0025BAEEA5|nr:hypothetical protein [Actinophytocola sp.]